MTEIKKVPWQWWPLVSNEKGSETSGHYGHTGGAGGKGGPGGSKPGGGHHTISGVNPSMSPSEREERVLDHKEGRGPSDVRGRTLNPEEQAVFDKIPADGSWIELGELMESTGLSSKEVMIRNALAELRGEVETQYRWEKGPKFFFRRT